MAEFSTSLVQTPHNISFLWMVYVLFQLGTEEASGYSICNGRDENALPPGEQVELAEWRDRNISLFPCRNVVSKSMC